MERQLKTKLMGIVNVTPDSFSDGGLFLNAPNAVDRAIQLAMQGAAIIDIGGESSRPGAEPVSDEVEISRAIPVIEEIADKLEQRISIDTYKSSVARRAIEAGAKMVNDISAMTADSKMLEVVAESGVELVLMHMLGSPRTMQVDPRYDDVVLVVCRYLAERADFAVKGGIAEDKIYLDPGIGFGKNLEDNLRLLASIRKIKSLGFPVVIGTSRKSFIEKILGRRPPSERLIGSLASFAWAVAQGADILRVHDVSEASEIIAVIEAIQEYLDSASEASDDTV